MYRVPEKEEKENQAESIRILYDPPPRILEIKAKINKWDLIKIKSFFKSKPQ